MLVHSEGLLFAFISSQLHDTNRINGNDPGKKNNIPILKQLFK